MTLKIPDKILNLKSTSCPKNIIGFCDACNDGPNYNDLCDRGRSVIDYYYKYCEEHNLEGWEDGEYK